VDTVVGKIEVLYRDVTGSWVILKSANEVNNAVDVSQDAAVDQHSCGAVRGRPAGLLINHEFHTTLFATFAHLFRFTQSQREGFLRQDMFASASDTFYERRTILDSDSEIHDVNVGPLKYILNAGRPVRNVEVGRELSCTLFEGVTG